MSEEEADDTPILDIKPALTKEENYPAWMRELITKEKKFNEMLECVKTEIQQVDKGLRELDEKKKTFRQVQRDYRPQKIQKQPEIQGDYHQYYSQLKYERNNKLSFSLINSPVASQIILFLQDPIKTCLVLQRVCQKWNYVFNSNLVWANLINHSFGENILKQISLENYKTFGVSIYKLLITSIKFIKQNSQTFNLTKDQVKLCQNGLQLIQRLLCIPENCYIKTKLLAELQSLDLKSSLDSILETHNHIVKQEAINLKITLQGISNYAYKTLVGISDLMKLKYRLNDQENNVILPSKYFYELTPQDAKILVNLSNPEDDYRKLKNLKEFNKFVVAKMNGQPLYMNLQYKKNEIIGNGEDEQRNLIVFQAQIRFDVQNINKQLTNGVEYYGEGELVIESRKERNHYDIYIIQDLKQKFYIIGSSGSDTILFEFL
ncbi:unnamed protein product (macronuclear) [Paramecium tetraurelia]|uniref:F-box domain-containing protein n=1 Tax=Paramecium tetraurelia TaxID=5888 RepID=A0C5E6_PARTE|nr:uncharacterized protein GSPATT00006512001 [Paramecium tetraurelia]CAK66013.1 unnamed protein product [Paramecium tetraurelia]|eukprot:XP_001433410.1 hypothetical protein (macronuclear) [Paramecium tetraurelia strain d4-2]